ncbi:hypothetical protein LNV08_18675 [Paucibacter sp. TC2R-5]|uniref:hypothetical protein n=1 Tax=Paucibacter sp. TC2R-5 TaxID=2893555 RepID=UPI0021E4D8BC|nr:hypothetical protein [Paucibacter sp. TC2R-5]MCV2361004.1 hypothetical protein [Paucibacter sp. TC2R-5]
MSSTLNLYQSQTQTQTKPPSVGLAEVLLHINGLRAKDIEMTGFRIQEPRIALGEFCPLISCSEVHRFDSAAVRAKAVHVLGKYPTLGTYGFRKVESLDLSALKRDLLLTSWGLRQICASLAFIAKYSKRLGGRISRNGGSEFFKQSAQSEANGYVMEGSFVAAALMHGLDHKHEGFTYFNGNFDWRALNRAPRGCANILIDGVPIGLWNNPVASISEGRSA